MVHFSRRTDWDRTPTPLAAAVERARGAGAALLDLTTSNPTRTGLAWSPDDLAAALSSSAVVRHDPAPLGDDAARAAVSADWERRGVRAPADRIALTASTSESYAFLFKALCDPGEGVLVPRPGYPLFEYLGTLEGVRIDRHHARWSDGRWELDVEGLADRLSRDTRAVLVVHPNNPTGTFLSDDEATRLARLCAERGLALISDEVFADFPWRGRPEVASLLDVGAREGALTVALGGLSKSCGLPHLKLGWAALAGPDDAVTELLGRLELVADTMLSVAAPVQHAAAALLARGAAFRARTAARLAENLARVDAVTRGSGLEALPGEGGWSVVLRLPGDPEDEAACLVLLEKDGVVVHPGYLFDLPEGHVVISLIVEPEVLREGLELIVARLAS